MYGNSWTPEIVDGVRAFLPRARESFIMLWLSGSLHFMKVFPDSQDGFFYVPG